MVSTDRRPARFLGPRSRVKTLYRARRRSVIEIPTKALTDRFGDEVTIDDHDYRWARVERDDWTIEVGFKGTFRMFGALIDTQWIGHRGDLGSTSTRYRYRFDKQSFRPTDAMAASLASEHVRTLAARSELKSIEVDDLDEGRTVEIIPLAGTITAMYVPPLPPYTVPIRPDEASDHLDLVMTLLDIDDQ